MLKAKASKSSGTDTISKPVIRELVYELADPVYYNSYNTSLASGVFPNIWKNAHITPTPNLLPVSLVDEMRKN